MPMHRNTLNAWMTHRHMPACPNVGLEAVAAAARSMANTF